MVLRKIAYLILMLAIISCGSSKNVVRTKTTSPKTQTTVVKKSLPKKIAPKQPIAKVVVKPKEVEKEVSISSSEELVATSKITTTTERVLAYIDSFKDVAKSNMKSHGIPASIKLAQGILESGAGVGRLSTIANNHFGIKCHKGWTGESVTHDDDAAQECFRKYNDPADSYRDHSLFLTSRSWYNGLFKLDKGDYVSWSKGLKAAGYATDPKYPEKLIGIIERYQLYQYDNEVLNRTFVPKTTTDVLNIEEGDYVIQQGDTLYSLSKKFNLSVYELQKMNNLSNNTISIGQKIKTK
jgi:flagellum-specific peptidoglycan hydrolase FlgJ